jgi:hypothetical protein
MNFPVSLTCSSGFFSCICHGVSFLIKHCLPCLVPFPSWSWSRLLSYPLSIHVTRQEKKRRQDKIRQDNHKKDKKTRQPQNKTTQHNTIITNKHTAIIGQSIDTEKTKAPMAWSKIKATQDY